MGFLNLDFVLFFEVPPGILISSILNVDLSTLNSMIQGLMDTV